MNESQPNNTQVTKSRRIKLFFACDVNKKEDSAQRSWMGIQSYEEYLVNLGLDL
jgi:hypothetical protein